MYRIALVKEACYQDLWVCEQSLGLKSLLETSLLRTGPLGLIDIFDCDFFILETNKSKAARKLRSNQIAHLKDNDYAKIENTKSELFNLSPKEIAKNPNSINWKNYDIVISINFAVPIDIRKRYDALVWICLTGEGKFPISTNSWDYFISHNCPSTPVLKRSIIDMPYTFISSDFFIKNYGKNSSKSGIYFEVNSFNNIKNHDLKKISPPQKFKKLNIPLRYHQGTMKSHIDNLIVSKYFVKFEGRPVRGNSFIEAISSECVCFLNYADCYGELMFPKYCYYSDTNELLLKINYLEGNEEERLRLISEQKRILDNIISNVDLQFQQAIKRKSKNKPKKRNLKEKIFNKFSYLFYFFLLRLDINSIDKLNFLPPLKE